MGAFLGLTFGLTWLLNPAVYLRGGLGIPGVSSVLQLQMLLPAFSAIVLLRDCTLLNSWQHAA